MDKDIRPSTKKNDSEIATIHNKGIHEKKNCATCKGPINATHYTALYVLAQTHVS